MIDIFHGVPGMARILHVIYIVSSIVGIRNISQHIPVLSAGAMNHSTQGNQASLLSTLVAITCSQPPLHMVPRGSQSINVVPVVLSDTCFIQKYGFLALHL
jgi:hypothetical protein